MEPDTNNNRVSSLQTTLRALFVGGYALSVGLWFVPSLSISIGGMFGFDTEPKSYTMVGAVRLLAQNGQNGTAFLYVLAFCAMVAFLVLSIKVPKKWVFIAGAAYAAFWTVLDFFAPEQPGIKYFFFPQVLGYIATAMILPGFWIRSQVAEAKSEKALSISA